MSLLTFERPTCGQVIGSTMTRLWLRFYAGSRRINEPATTMNDDDYESRLLLPFRFLQHIAAASIISTIRRSFFFFWRGQYGKKRKTYTHHTHSHAHTHTCTQHTTHHSSKSISGFFSLFVMLVFWHTTTTITTTQQCWSLCLFQFRFVIMLFLLLSVAFIGYPGVKIQDVPNKDP